jgi:hypothetical protein
VRVSIHQPNYAPWLGFFRKIALADTFVFLDDVQFSKGSYTNRVQILSGSQPAWLSVPVSFAFGDPIIAVDVGKAGFVDAHLRRLEGAYKGAAAFREVWPDVETIYRSLPDGPLAGSNIALLEAICGRLGIEARFLRSSDLGFADLASDDRLIALVQALDPQGTYLSGKGGATYQDPRKFAAAGLKLEYLDFVPPAYPQAGTEGFVPGLSVLDAIFNVGFEGTAALVRT